MRDEMVFAALRCKRPKWLVFWHLMRGKRFEEEELFYAPDELPMEAREALAAYQQSVERNPTIRSFLEIAGDFGPPGRCFHLKPTGRTSHTASRRGPFNLRHGKQRRYRAVWIDGHAIIDEGVLISGRMMADHLPDYLLATLRSMARSLRRHQSTAVINDRAGERLTEDVMEGAGDSSGSRHNGGGGGSSEVGNGGNSNGNGSGSGGGNDTGSRSQQGGSRVGGITRPPPQEPEPQRLRLAAAAPPPMPPSDLV
jgi:sn1-specific diacylglycerol lipase